ncbi:glycosyl hydrolase 53 family protein [Paenibacillus wynnii]|uniref:glycosyl hydrolase 53 family protein n=1 Tax=Paenibacillus wynnii TaxID=268407 RepID=UPI00068E98C4|nr:glycosyl hydrolase 53 family protein [Paenibacillus wynnii]
MKRFRRTLSALMAFIMVAVAGLSMGSPNKAYASAPVNLVVNPGFEMSGDSLTGWDYSGNTGVKGVWAIGSGGGNIHSGTKSLNYYYASAYQFSLSQSIKNLPDGEYVLKAWASGGGGENAAKLFVSGYGGDKKQSVITNTGWDKWSQYTVSGIQVTGGEAIIGFEVDAPAGTWGYFDDIEFYKVPVWSQAKALTTSNVSATGATLDWSGVEASTQVTGYRVFKNGVFQASTTGTSYVVSGLAPNTQYTFKVEAENGTDVVSTDGPSVEVTTVEVASGNVPSWQEGKSLTASQLTSRGVMLAWSDAQDEVGVTHYQIYENGSLKATVTGATYQLTGLSPGTAYTYRVEAGNAASLWSTTGPSVNVETPAVPAEPFIKGADISSLQAVEDAGGRYYDQGVEKDLLDILQDHGVNYIRVRIWNNPLEVDGYNDKAHVVALAKRVKAKGMKLLLDFHYSDFWTDPGKQVKPAAWKDLSFNELQQAVYDYTTDVMNELKEENAYPDMVQIGNEINPGMLLPDGSNSDYDKLSSLLKKGIQAVRDTTPTNHEVKIMLHLAEGGNNSAFRSFFDAMRDRNVNYDVIGASYYAYWHGPFNNLKNNLNDMAARYGKEVLVAETSYGSRLGDGDGFPDSFTESEAAEAGFPATVEGQAQLVTTVMNTVANVPNGKGVGVFYWEPAWIPVPKDAEGHYQAGWKTGEGSSWNNQAMFDFEGNALASLDAFKFQPGDLAELAALITKDPAGITVAVNESVVNVKTLLPKTVDVLFNEGSVKQVPVEWQEIEQEDLSRIGSFELTGQVEGVGKTVKVTVTVTSYKNIAINPSFESSVSSTGWTLAGTTGVASFKSDAGNAYAGNKAVNYWSNSAYQFILSQALTGLSNGTYVLKVKVSGGGGENGIHLFAENYGDDKLTSGNIVNSGWQQWNEGTLGNINVTNGQATIGLSVDAPATSDGIWGWIDSFEFYKQVQVPQWESSKSLTASDLSARSIKLAWSGVSETDPVSGYKIYKDGKLLTSVTGATYTVSNLLPNTAYTFKVETSLDGAIWTSTGPSVSVTTPADPITPDVPTNTAPTNTTPTNTTPTDTVPGQSSVVTLQADQLLGGKTVVNVPVTATEIKLPANVAELLAGAPLQLKAGALMLDIPASLFEQLTKGLAAGDQPVSISLTMKSLTDAESTKRIAQVEKSANAAVRVIGSLYDFGLSITTTSGKTINLNKFNEPIKIRIMKPVPAVTGPIGIFYIADNGSVQYIGGQQEGNFITAKISHFSKYALLEVQKSFSDVPATHWASDAIGQLAGRLLISGVGTNTFEPSREVTRAEYVAMLVRALKLEATTTHSKFTDVSEDAWYAGAVAAATDLGIIQGREANRFEPNRPITREEMAKITVLAVTSLKNSTGTGNQGESSTFIDADLASAWAKPYVQSVSELGWMSGREAGYFVPKAKVTRAEAAQIIWRMLK